MTTTMILILMATLLACTAARTLTFEKVSLSLSESEAKDLDISKTVEDILSDSLRLDEIDFSGLGDCDKGTCCINYQGYKVCFTATLKGKAIHIDLAVNGHSIISIDVTGASPPEACMKSPPKPLTKACLLVKDVDLTKLSGCVYVEVEAHHVSKTIKIDCFKLNGADVMLEKKPTNDVIELPAGSVLKFRSEE